MSRTLTARFCGIAVPRLRSHSQQQAAVGLSSDEVELYHRTYTTLLRSSGETLVRVLEPSHRAMNSSLHPLAASEEIDLGAFIYATQRLPQEVPDAKVIVMGQEAKVFQDAGIGPIEDWQPLEAPARRRRWFHDGDGHARGAARLGLGPRRPDPDARRLPDRVEQAARAPALARLAAGRRARSRRLRGGARRRGGGLVAAARRVALELGDAHARRRRAAPEPARPHARRQRRRLRAHDAPLVAAGADDAAGAPARGPADLLRLLQRPLDRQPASRAPPASASSEITEWVDRLRRPRPQARARPLPLGRGRGVVGELPLLRGARVLHRAARGLPHLRAALGRGARGRRDAPLQPHRAARLGAGDPGRPARPSARSTRGSASPTRSGSPPAPP